MTEARPSNYWIASNALYITLNANGGPDYLLGNTASGAHILCYMKGIDGLEYDAGHNYRRWPLSLTPTHFETYTEKYVYCAIPRPGNAAEMAVIVFPSERLDIYGKNEIGQQIGSEQYYYIWLQGIISSSGITGANDRGWTQHVDTGTLASDEAMNAGGDETWWRYSAVDDTVTFLKEIVMDAKSVFHNLKARLLVLAGHELTGVATADTSDEFVDSETLVVTPSYLKKNTEDKFLRKDQDDATPYSLTVGGILRAVTGYFTSLYSNLVQSTNYTGDGIADTGYRLTADDGTGSSALIVDNLHVRKKATFEELEVKKETSVAGNEIRSAAANVINRTDYIDQNGDVIGYSYTKVPWLLRQMPFLLRHKFFGRLRRVRISIDPEHVGDIKKIRCYFLAKDGDRDVKNLWQAHDLVRCQTFNISRSNRFTYIGTKSQSKAGNVFWWRKAVLVSTNPVAIDDKEYHYFDVSMDDCAAGSDIPCAGDHAVQFGNDSDSERMNLIIQEVNGDDAPAIKAYTGIYTYDLNKCWWGGSPRKMMLSPTQGYEFYGPSFRYVQEYGVKPAAIDRGAWSEIATERDDYGQHAQVRKCYYYDKVTHKGCYWLCVFTPSGNDAHWVDASGNYLTQAQYDALTEEQKATCSRKEDYTTAEPGTNDAVWQKQVDRGTSVKSVTSYYAKQTAAQYTGEPPTSGWQSSIAAVGTLNEGDYLWTKNITTYSDTLEDTTTFTVSKWGIDGDGIENIETKFYEDIQLLTQAQLAALTENKWVEYNQLSLTKGDYIYTRTKITYDKASTPTISYQVNRIGQDGVGYVGTEEYYVLGNSQTNVPSGHPYTGSDPYKKYTAAEWQQIQITGGWSESRPTYQGDNKKYLWNFEVSFDTDGNAMVTKPICIGDYAKGIATIVELYAISAYSVAPQAGGYPADITTWTDEAHDCAPTDAKPYQWNKTVTTYTDGSSDTFYHVSAVKGTKGDKPQAGVDYPIPQNGNDAYSVTIEPADILFTQSTTKNAQGVYPLVDNPKTATVIVKKGNSNSSVAHSVSIQSVSNCQATASGDTITVKGVIGNYTEGSATVRVTITNGPTFDLKLNVYYNLLGTWKESVEDGTETVIAQKLSYEIFDDGTHTIEDTGEYVRGWGDNTSKLTKKVDGLITSTSEIKQTADEIKMSVNSGFRNFILNPKATDAIKAVGQMEEDNDVVMGRVMNVYNSSTGDFQLLCRFDDDNRTLLNNQKVVCYMVVKPLSSSGTICFGIWSATHHNSGMLRATYNGGVISVHSDDVGEAKTGAVPVGNGWYICWSSFNAGAIFSEVKESNGINSVNNTRWDVYGYGILVGEGCPSLEAILTNTGLRSTGIDILDGNIIAKADNFKIENSNNKETFSVDKDGNLIANGGSITAQGTSQSRWEISTEVHEGSYKIPTIIGYDTDGNKKIQLIYDGDAGDIVTVGYGGGLSFLKQESGVTSVAGGYFQNYWRVISSSGGSFIDAMSGYNPIISCQYEGQKTLDIGADSNGAMLKSNNWPTQTANEGRVYKDAWCRLRVYEYGNNTVDAINVETSSFTLPKDPPVGTQFFVKKMSDNMTIRTSDAYVLNGSNNGTLWEPNTTYNWDDTHSMVLFYLGKIGNFKYWSMIYSN